MANLYNLINKLRRDEAGAAFTEYLILLALAAGGIAAGVTAFGGDFGTAIGDWATWFAGDAAAPA